MKKILFVFIAVLIGSAGWSRDADLSTMGYVDGLLMEDRAVALDFPARFTSHDSFASITFDASIFENFYINAGGGSIKFIGLMTSSGLSFPVALTNKIGREDAPVAFGGGVAFNLGSLAVGGVLRFAPVKTIESNAVDLSITRLGVVPSVKLKLAEVVLDVALDLNFSFGNAVEYVSAGGGSTNTNTYSPSFLAKRGLKFVVSKDISDKSRVSFWGGVYQKDNSIDISSESGSFKTNYSRTDNELGASFFAGLKYEVSESTSLFGSIGFGFKHVQYNEDYALSGVSSYEYRKDYNFPQIQLALKSDIGSGFSATFGSLFIVDSYEQVNKTPNRVLSCGVSSPLNLYIGLDYSYEELEIRSQLGAWVYSGNLYPLGGGASPLFAKVSVYYALSPLLSGGK